MRLLLIAAALPLVACNRSEELASTQPATGTAGASQGAGATTKPPPKPSVVTKGRHARAVPSKRRPVSLPVSTRQRLPIYQPKNAVERLGTAAALSSLDSRGEGATVVSILNAAPSLLKLPKSRRQATIDALVDGYRELERDGVWKDLDSPMASAFESRTPMMLIVPPRGKSALQAHRPKVIWFLHGYGGNGKLYAWLLARALPDVWIVSPSHGVSWRRPNLTYLAESRSAFLKFSKLRAPTFVLVGLSDGAMGGFQVMNSAPPSFAAFVSIAGHPLGSARRIPTNTPILMLNSRTDRMVSAATAAGKQAQLKRRGAQVSIEWFKGGHYFLLHDPQALKRIAEFAHSLDAPR